MSNPQMPNIPGAAVMTDTLDFVKNLWGSMGVPGLGVPGMPGLTVPTLSVEELDKKINDLKAVETWLNLNVSMLRGSIQAMEVQRGTIATLKSVGASLAAAVNQGTGDRSMFDSNPYASAFFQHANPAAKPAAPQPSPTAAKPAPPAPAPAAQQAATASPAADAAAQMANPAVWWNMLQEQFKQAVSTAMTSDAVTGAAAMASDAAAKFAAAATGKPSEPIASSDQPKPRAKAARADSDNAPASAKAPVKRAPGKPAKE